MLRPGITRERLVGLCLLGALLFSPIVISIFDLGADVRINGIPVLLLYLFGSWALLILFAAIIIFRRQSQLKHMESDIEEDL